MKRQALPIIPPTLQSLSWAQCTGIFPPNTLCGNLSGSPAPPGPFTASGTIVGPGSTTLNGLPLWANTSGTQLKDGAGQTIAGSYTWAPLATGTNTITWGANPFPGGVSGFDCCTLWNTALTRVGTTLTRSTDVGNNSYDEFGTVMISTQNATNNSKGYFKGPLFLGSYCEDPSPVGFAVTHACNALSAYSFIANGVSNAFAEGFVVTAQDIGTGNGLLIGMEADIQPGASDTATGNHCGSSVPCHLNYWADNSGVISGDWIFDTGSGTVGAGQPKWLNGISVRGIAANGNALFIPNNTVISAQNAAGNAVVPLISLDTSNALNLTASGNVLANAGGANGFFAGTGGIYSLTANSSTVTAQGTGGLVVGAPTGGSKGAGTVNATALYVNGNPAGGWVLLNTLTASNSANLQDTTSLTATYTNYKAVFTNIIPATSNAQLQVQFQVSGTFQTTGYLGIFAVNTISAGANGGLTTAIPVTGSAASNGIFNGAPGLSGHMNIYNPGAAAIIQAEGSAVYAITASTVMIDAFGGYFNTSGAVTGLQFKMSSGNITSGTIRIYGSN